MARVSAPQQAHKRFVGARVAEHNEAVAVEDLLHFRLHSRFQLGQLGGRVADRLLQVVPVRLDEVGSGVLALR